MIAIRKRIFDEDMDRIYTKVNDTLKDNEIIPTKGIKEALKKLDTDTKILFFDTNISPKINEHQNIIIKVRTESFDKIN